MASAKTNAVIAQGSGDPVATSLPPVTSCVASTDHWVLDNGVWIEQVGEAHLARGWAEVVLADAFVVRADLARYQVMLTSCDAASLFVFNRSAGGFEIHDAGFRAARHSIRCCYRAIALCISNNVKGES